jgi:hypothetical protein
VKHEQVMACQRLARLVARGEESEQRLRQELRLGYPKANALSIDSLASEFLSAGRESLQSGLVDVAEVTGTAENREWLAGLVSSALEVAQHKRIARRDRARFVLTFLLHMSDLTEGETVDILGELFEKPAASRRKAKPCARRTKRS